KNKYTIKAGARYEYTTIDARDQVKDIAIPAYGNLVPSVNISKTFGNTTLKAAYNKRIQRPGLQQLNPNFNLANPQNITIGNPSLRPEITDNIELSASANIKKVYLNASVFGRMTNNSILRLSAPSDTLIGAIVTTFQNIGTQQVFGTNVFGNFNITSKWSVNGGIDLYYNYLEGQVQGGVLVPRLGAEWQRRAGHAVDLEEKVRSGSLFAEQVKRKEDCKEYNCMNIMP
ncbi:MAG: TonB-dependent receptor, partial [Cytophagaceae bacterium]